MATIVGGSDIYLMDLTGMTIAANNFGQPNTFVGNNYAFRPYFQGSGCHRRLGGLLRPGSSLLGTGAVFHQPGS